MVSVLAVTVHYATSSLIWRNARTYMTSFIAKNLLHLKWYIIKRKFNFFEFFVKRENVYFIRGFATHENAFFASLGEINGIFIPKIWIFSIYGQAANKVTPYIYFKMTNVPLNKHKYTSAYIYLTDFGQKFTIIASDSWHIAVYFSKMYLSSLLCNACYIFTFKPT